MIFLVVLSFGNLVINSWFKSISQNKIQSKILRRNNIIFRFSFQQNVLYIYIIWREYLTDVEIYLTISNYTLNILTSF